MLLCFVEPLDDQCHVTVENQFGEINWASSVSQIPDLHRCQNTIVTHLFFSSEYVFPIFQLTVPYNWIPYCSKLINIRLNYNEQTRRIFKRIY